MDRQERLTSEDRRIRNDFIIDPQPFLTGQRSLFTEKELLETAGSWVKNVTETESEGMRLFGDHYYQFRYEDLMAEPWEEMSKIWKFLGAENLIRNCAKYLQAEMYRKPG